MRRSAFATAMEFFKYTPQARGSCPNYTNFLDKLGFEKDGPATQVQAYQYRHKFIVDMKRHVNLSDLRCLCRDDDELAFERMINDFLSNYGIKYWGPRSVTTLLRRTLPRDFCIHGTRSVRAPGTDPDLLRY